MTSARRFASVSLYGACAVVTAVGIARLGTEQWVVGHYLPSAAPKADVWGGHVKPVVATEAEWLRSHPGLHNAIAPGVTQIDLGPLDIIEVRPLPADLGVGDSAGGAATPKLLISAREASGRIVRLIVERPVKPVGPEKL